MLRIISSWLSKLKNYFFPLHNLLTFALWCNFVVEILHDFGMSLGSAYAGEKINSIAQNKNAQGAEGSYYLHVGKR